MVSNSKVWLEPTMREPFKTYMSKRVHSGELRGLTYPHIKHDWDNLDTFFNYCLDYKTWADFIGQCIVAGQIKCAGTTKIFCDNGRTISTKQGIIEYQANEYSSDYDAWLDDNIFHNMFCEFEWLTRGRCDYADKEYRKVFKKSQTK